MKESQYSEEQIKTKDLLTEVNELHRMISENQEEKIKISKETKAEQEKRQQQIETLNANIASLQRVIKEKERRLAAQETKIIDMQEENVLKMNSEQKDMAESKMMYEHQLTEFRKHITQLEIENQTYKQ